MQIMNQLTLICCVYNAQKFLQKNYYYIVNQSIFNEINVLFINDGSTDETFGTLSSLYENYSNVKIYNNEENKGTYYSRKKASELATTKYLLFVDVDDVPSLFYCEMFLNLIATKQADLVFNYNHNFEPYFVISENKKLNEVEKTILTKPEILNVEKVDWNNIKKIKNFPTNLAWNFICKTDLWKNVPYVDKKVEYEDAINGILLTFYAKKIVLVSLTNAYFWYGMNPESMSKKKFNVEHIIFILQTVLEHLDFNKVENDQKVLFYKSLLYVYFLRNISNINMEDKNFYLSEIKKLTTYYLSTKNKRIMKYNSSFNNLIFGKHNWKLWVHHFLSLFNLYSLYWIVQKKWLKK